MSWLASRADVFIRWVRDHPKTEKIPVGPNIEDPTYWRYFVIRRNRWLNFYLHNFHHDDEENLHDHRAANISFILQGSYYDQRFIERPLEGLPLPSLVKHFRPQYSLTFRLPSTPHRVVLPRDDSGREVPCWSLFIKFSDIRDWGFWCAGNRRMCAFWRPFEQYVASTNPTGIGYGQRGRGCGD